MTGRAVVTARSPDFTKTLLAIGVVPDGVDAVSIGDSQGQEQKVSVHQNVWVATDTDVQSLGFDAGDGNADVPAAVTLKESPKDGA